MVKHCRRCGLPRRRILLTPDGKTFSFGFSVRRHRGLLLASGAALCCCCVDRQWVPISDALAGGWVDTVGGDSDGQLWDEIDESWPSDDSTTYITKTGGGLTFTCDLTTGLATNGWLGAGRHVARWRLRQSTAGTMQCVLQRNITVIVIQTFTIAASNTWETHEIVLTEAQYNNIVDFDALKIIVTESTGSGSDCSYGGYLELCP